jgi:hypothetical protein
MGKKILLTILALISLGIFSTQANAGFLIEPYLGYTISGEGEQLSSNTDLDWNGVEFGGRLGLTYLGLMAGVHYGMSSFEWEETNTVTNTVTKDDNKMTNIGAFVGFEFPLLIRVWGTYIFNSEVEDDLGADIGDTLDGTGYGLGVGYTGLPFVSLNLEYRSLTYDESTDVSTAITSQLTGNSEVTASTILLSISLPFSL